MIAWERGPAAADRVALDVGADTVGRARGPRIGAFVLNFSRPLRTRLEVSDY